MGQQPVSTKQTVPAKQTTRETFVVLPGSYELNGHEVGEIKLNDSSISTIVKRATLSVEGVSRLSGSSFIDNIAELVRSKKIQERSITVSIEKGKLAVEVSVNVFYGSNLPRVAQEIQTSVSNAIFAMTGIHPARIDVSFREIEDPAAVAEEESESEPTTEQKEQQQ